MSASEARITGAFLSTTTNGPPESSGDHLLQKLASLHVTVRVEDITAFLRAACNAGWSAVDSGDRVTTDEGVDKEAVLIVQIPMTQALSDIAAVG